MSSKSDAGALKLCKRTYFLQNGNVPNQSAMREELGSEMANVILECLSPACQAWMGVDRKLRGPSEYCLDPNVLKYNIHEHILDIGRRTENRLEHKRRRMVVEKGIDEDELEFLKFECRQKIEIARAEERKRMEQQLNEAQAEMRETFIMKKKQLGEDFYQVRREMARYMCKNFRRQAGVLIAKVAKQYREEIGKEVSKRVDRSILMINDQLDEIVLAAVQKQKAVDLKEMQTMSYRYEELLRNVQNHETCRHLTTLAQHLCSQMIKTPKRKDNSEISCQTSLIMPEVEQMEETKSIDDSKGFEEPSNLLETNDIFLIKACFMMPAPSPVYSLADSDSAGESDASSSTLQAFTFEGNVYAQPKYYRKFHEKLIHSPTFTWSPINTDEHSISFFEELNPIDSNFTREVINQMLTNQDLEQTEEVLATLDMEVSPVVESTESKSSETTISDLFDFRKSESEIAVLANGIALKYIRATEKDFD